MRTEPNNAVRTVDNRRARLVGRAVRHTARVVGLGLALGLALGGVGLAVGYIIAPVVNVAVVALGWG